MGGCDGGRTCCNDCSWPRAWSVSERGTSPTVCVLSVPVEASAGSVRDPGIEVEGTIGERPRTRGRRRRWFDWVIAFVRSEALAVFLWSRAAIWLGALLALFVIRPNRGLLAERLDVPRLTRDLGSVTDVWARWDSVHY